MSRHTPPEASPDVWNQAAWDAILADIPDPHPFLHPAWQRAWWTHFGTGHLAVLTLETSPECTEAEADITEPSGRRHSAPGRGVVAIAALEIKRGCRARFLGSRQTTDYPGPAVRPGAAGAAAGALLHALHSHAARPRALELDNAREEDGLAGALADAARASGFAVEVAGDEQAAVLHLPSTRDGYFDRLSRHTRHELGRKRRRLQQVYPASRTRTASAATLENDLRVFCALHRRARGQKAAFMTATMERFLREVAAAALDAGTLRLDTLEDGHGRPLAVTLGFQGPRTYYLYNMAFDPGAAALSPGIVLLTGLIERAIGDGLARFDFLRGLERYKLELGARPTNLRRVRVELR